MKKYIAIVLVALALVNIAAAAESCSITTTVYFNVASVVGFTLTLPGGYEATPCGVGAATAAIEFNSTTGTNSDVNAKVQSGSMQDLTTPIFSYDNTGTVPLDITVVLDSALPSCMTLTGATSYAAAPSGSAISTTPVTVATNFGPNDPVITWWMMADFNACTASDSTSRTLTSTGTKTA